MGSISEIGCFDVGLALCKDLTISAARADDFRLMCSRSHIIMLLITAI